MKQNEVRMSFKKVLKSHAVSHHCAGRSILFYPSTNTSNFCLHGVILALYTCKINSALLPNLLDTNGEETVTDK